MYIRVYICFFLFAFHYTQSLAHVFVLLKSQLLSHIFFFLIVIFISLVSLAVSCRRCFLKMFAVVVAVL